MLTEIGYNDELLKWACDIINKDGVVAFPTETVYGLGASAFSEKGIEKIFEVKGRPRNNPLIVHLSELADVEIVAENIPDVFYALYESFCPGPLTMILPRNKNIPYSVTAGLDSVAVRFPRHKVARELIQGSGVPIVAPSANKSKHVSPTSSKHVYDDFKGDIPLILEGGASEVGIESTVLSLVTEVPTILRPGAITMEMLLQVLDRIVHFTGEIKVAASPGMLHDHYMPRSEAVLAETPDSLIAEYDRKAKEGIRPVIIARDRLKGLISDRNFISLGNSDSEACCRLYAALREGEAYDYIIVENQGDKGVAYSVMNRVLKATKGKIV